MELVRKICELGHAQRKLTGIKVRQPLKSCQLSVVSCQLNDEFLELIRDELNVKEVIVKKGEEELTVVLNTTITPELQQEGEALELVRQVQQLRKEKWCRLDQKISLQLPEQFKNLPLPLQAYIKKETLAGELVWGEEISILIP